MSYIYMEVMVITGNRKVVVSKDIFVVDMKVMK